LASALSVGGCKNAAPGTPEAGDSAIESPTAVHADGRQPPQPDTTRTAAPGPKSATKTAAPMATLVNAQGAANVAADADDGDEADEADEAGATPDTAVADGPQTVLILGDSLAATGVGALLERKLDATDGVVCHRKGKSASGLARPDFFDWIAEGKRQVDLRDPDLVVVIMGGNDGQDITRRSKGETRVPWKHDSWPERYRARMDEFLGQISVDRKVLWLGLPTMGLRSLEKKLVLIRQIQKAAVEAAGPHATYLDTTSLSSTDSGEMLTHAPVGHKTPKKLRADDRIHFTMAGSEYFAERVLPTVLETLGVDADDTAEDGSK
jgi:hypothetical protein